MLGEVAWKVMLTPDLARLLRAGARPRGSQIAATATARKLVVLFWHLLTREEDYAYARPAMTRNKIRGLELLAGAPPQKGHKGIAGNKSKALYEAGASSRRAKRPIGGSSTTGAQAARGKRVRARHRGAHLPGPRRAKPRGRLRKPLGSALRYVSHPHPTKGSHQPAQSST